MKELTVTPVLPLLKTITNAKNSYDYYCLVKDYWSSVCSVYSWYFTLNQSEYTRDVI